MLFTKFTIFSTKLKKHEYIWNKIEETTLADSFFYVSSFIFKETHILIEGIDKDDIGNLVDLLRLVLINEECGNPKVFVDGGELTRNIAQKKKPDVLQACRCPLCDKCSRREYFFYKHLGYCQSVR